MTRLIVENVHRIPNRPWVFVTGRLEDGELRIGDELIVAHDDVSGVSAVIRSIELHGEPGKITVAIDADVPCGSVPAGQAPPRHRPAVPSDDEPGRGPFVSGLVVAGSPGRDRRCRA